jgi:hypothetical protein
VPYVWVLWGGGLDPLRTFYPHGLYGNFYEIQARALFHGHWNVPSGSLGVEGFIVHGREYTYFGPLPSLLRMPILAITSSLDGRLTTPSMLLSWLVTGSFASLLFWRVRVIIRGEAPVGRGEAASAGLLLATVMGGSVLVYLATAPYVFDEDFAWSVATTVGALFALVGVLERPSAKRVIAAGGLILAASLARSPTGWACVIGALLIAVWFAAGRGGADNRRWCLPMLAAGLLPLAVGCYVTWVKFGTPFGLPLSSQVWTQTNPHRRAFLAANGGKDYNLSFLPSTLLAYFRPDGLRLTQVYPFITLPASPPRAVGNAVLDMTYRSTSVPASMPLLLLLTFGAIAGVFRRRPPGRAYLLRIPLIAAGAGVAGVIVWGYIANRYLADFVPVLLLGSAIGIVLLWRRLEGQKTMVRRTVLTAVAVVACFGLVANVAIASTPTDPAAWQGGRAKHYVQLQRSVGDVIGHSLSHNVIRGTTVPSREPADKLFVLNDCAALYLSSGDQYHPWIPVEYGPGIRHVLSIVYRTPPAQLGSSPILTIGRFRTNTIAVDYAPGGLIRFRYTVPPFLAVGSWLRIQPGRAYQVTIDADTALPPALVDTDLLTVTMQGQQLLAGFIYTDVPQAVVNVSQPQAGEPVPTLNVTEVPVSTPPLCRSLLGGTSR